MVGSSMHVRSLQDVLSALEKGRVPTILATRFDPAMGEDLVGRDRLVAALRRAVIQDSPAVFAETAFDAPTVPLLEVLEAAREISLLSPRRLVLVRGGRVEGGGTEAESPAPDSPGLEGAPEDTPGADDDTVRLRALARYLDDDGRSACIAFIGCGWDGRRKVHKALLAAATVLDVSRPDPKEIPDWIDAHVRHLGARIERAGALALAELRGNDTLRLAGEIEKLLVHCLPESTISREDVLALVGESESSSAWMIGEAIVEGNAERGMSAIRALLADGQSVPMIVGAIASRLRQLVVLSEEAGTGRVNESARRVVFPGRSIYFAEALARKAAHYPSGALASRLAALYDLDKRSKSTSIDPRMLLEEWLLGTLRSRSSVRSSLSQET